MRRLAYFGTDLCAGHSLTTIRGKFSQEEIRDLERIDELFECDSLRFKFFTFGKFGCLGFPASPDDKRNGSKTIFFVEDAKTKTEVLYELGKANFVKRQFQKISEMYHVAMPHI